MAMRAMDYGFPFRMPTITARSNSSAASPSPSQQGRPSPPPPRVQQHPFQPHTLVQQRAQGGITEVPVGVRALMCGYPSKICTNERAWKRDGSQHRFCEEHRKRANTNQKRWAQRRAKAKVDKHSASDSPFVAEYEVEGATLMEDFTEFDASLDALLSDAHFWSPSAKASASKSASQWDNLELAQGQSEDAVEAELWAALGLGNVNLSL